jgi:deoxyribodipyrimidine photo-lyase
MFNHLVWFRRDLRAHDQTALHHALKAASLSDQGLVLCVFIFDTDILNGLPKADRRVDFIWHSLVDLDLQIQALSHGKARLLVKHGCAKTEIPALVRQLGIHHLHVNHDDEPASQLRDSAVATAIKPLGVILHSYKDHVIFERQEVMTQAGKPYTVFTPYKNAWLKKLSFHSEALASDIFALQPFEIQPYVKSLAPCSPALYAQFALPSLAQMGFESTDLALHHISPGTQGATQCLNDFLPRMARYHDARDYPAIKGPSYLSVHLRFGTISIRQLAFTAYQTYLHGKAEERQGAQMWLSELIWRDFYHQIMANFPHAVQGSFKTAYDHIQWEQGAQATALYQAWCEARTGYPLVDAAMRQLNTTGYMHNRLRMVVASFFTKDLGLDWRWGADYFAEKLIDFDLAANNGGWQWAASSGCDAQPYFRIFNPTTQSQKFDPDGKFIRRYLPEFANLDHKAIHLPRNPIIDHAAAREKTLLRYAVVKATDTVKPAV